MRSSLAFSGVGANMTAMRVSLVIAKVMSLSGA
jgi:hypothetical protein